MEMVLSKRQGSEADYVMLTGDDGVPKVLLGHCLLSQEGGLFVVILGSASRLWKPDVFLKAASSGRLALRGHVSAANASVGSGGGGWPFVSDPCQHLCVSLM